MASSIDPSQYMALIQADPLYQKTVADLNAQSASDSAQLGQGILSSLVNRGVVPDLDAVAAKLGLPPSVVAFLKQNVDLGQARALAAQANASGVSQQAQLDRAHRGAMDNIKSSLAARGMLGSGATPFLGGEEAHNYGLANYDADKALSDYISGAYAAFAKSEQGRQSQLEQALSDAYARQQSQLDSAKPGGKPAPPSSTTTPAPPAPPPFKAN